MLAQKITRTKVKGQGARKASSPDTEPRLYEYPWMKEEEEAGLAVNSSNDNSVASLSGIISDPMNDTTTTIVANNSPAMSLGDALSYFNFGDLRSIHDNWDTAAQNHQYTSSTQDLNHQATLRSLLGSSGTRTFVPIAPAPPANKSLEDNPGAVNMQQLISQDSYHSVLNALRATAQQQQQQQQQQLPSLGFGGDNSNGSNGNNVPPANWLTQPGPTFF